MIMDLPKRTWAEIDLGAIAHNYREMRSRLPDGTRFLGVVKSNAYGHGAVKVASLLETLGADYLAVACLDEAIELRENGISLPILILGPTPTVYTPELIRYNITQSLVSTKAALEMNELALGLGQTVRVHLKVDSGMGRVGFICREDRDPEQEMADVMTLKGLDVEGIFTHFAVSDVLGDAYTDVQFKRFTGLISRLEAKSGRKFKIRHCTNSGAMINYADTYLDMVRPGIALYGCYPDKDKGDLTLMPAMSVRTRIAQIKTYRDGDTISYGRTYTVHGTKRIAVVPIGYADGLHRVLSGKIDMLVRGKRVQQVGRICMDMCMLDITDIPDAEEGDIVTLFGRDGDEFIPIEEQAEKAGTISYEFMCDMAPRVTRIYK